jgi:hypothetical protein
MKSRVYLETTIPSYLTAWPSRDVVMAAHQQTTREWWESRRGEFELFISQFVIDEAALGDAGAAKRRLEVLANLPLLNPIEDVYHLQMRLWQGFLCRAKRRPIPCILRLPR